MMAWNNSRYLTKQTIMSLSLMIIAIMLLASFAVNRVVSDDEEPEENQRRLRIGCYRTKKYRSSNCIGDGDSTGNEPLWVSLIVAAILLYCYCGRTCLSAILIYCSLLWTRTTTTSTESPSTSQRQQPKKNIHQTNDTSSDFQPTTGYATFQDGSKKKNKESNDTNSAPREEYVPPATNASLV